MDNGFRRIQPLFGQHYMKQIQKQKVTWKTDSPIKMVQIFANGRCFRIYSIKRTSIRNMQHEFKIGSAQERREEILDEASGVVLCC